MKSKYIIVGAFILASVAFAVKQVKYSTVNDPNPQYFPVGIYVGPQSPANTPVVGDVRNKVTAFLGTQCDYDFPSIAPGYSIHQTDKTCSLPGVKVGDPCFAAIVNPTANGNDAGSPIAFGLEVMAIARKADVVEISLNNIAGDGGSFNQPDSGFNVRCISNQ